jgi:pimeloyl-ACP methyl ester carboxylesterase
MTIADERAAATTRHGVPPLDETRLRHAFVEVDAGVRLHCVELGEGPLVVLLHGFPDFWYGWRRQIPALAAAGFRVVVPDLRGYDLSDKPPGVRAYGIRTIVRDVATLVERLGEPRAHLIGHDLGAGVAWAFAMTHPERLGRLAVLNGPHPQRLLASLRRPSQLAKSWYVFFFQLPWLPEWWLARDGYATLVRAIRDEPTRPGAVTEDDVARYREAWSQPGALTATVRWYRAMFRPGTAVPMRRVDAPTLVLWGEADPHLGAELAAPKPELVPSAQVVRLPGASHWVQHDEPTRVNDALVAWLGKRS